MSNFRKKWRDPYSLPNLFPHLTTDNLMPAVEMIKEGIKSINPKDLPPEYFMTPYGPASNDPIEATLSVGEYAEIRIIQDTPKTTYLKDAVESLMDDFLDHVVEMVENNDLPESVLRGEVKLKFGIVTIGSSRSAFEWTDNGYLKSKETGELIGEEGQKVYRRSHDKRYGKN